MSAGVFPARVVEALRRSFATHLRVEWRPNGPPPTLRVTSGGIDGDLYWDCRASFEGLAPFGVMLGRPAREATGGALVHLVEALEREAVSLRARAAGAEEGESKALREQAVRMDAAAILGRMTIEEIEGLW